MNRLYVWSIVLAVIASPQVGLAGSSAPSPYRVIDRDVIHVAVNGEPDVTTDSRVDSRGEINVPLIGAVKVAGLTTSQIQALIARLYVTDQIYVHPEVDVTVTEFCPRDVMVLGQVTKQGQQPFPPEATSLSIVEAITAAGGLTRIAKGDGVRVTRKDEQGHERSFTVDVEKFIEGRAGKTAPFMLEPGDIVFVPERTF